ncbi:MAG: hypothetical protein UY76_C0015G0011 [Candidatus Uhrbacteria bacterium GW2011_GWA2_52_8d]|uniref:Uncharacterized protein n=1 Tax=Candidatus Uhrbacteria bacterium GW2011_GWA2_52_8d TaxID=1618979 RepID=A0A0G1XPR6_9BACT|nr:MAG: hypothetical protein UY76_C0015G0011 [Candidatus Uhrbacteria bacterium GW2011_GWA2_52_8d]
MRIRYSLAGIVLIAASATWCAGRMWRAMAFDENVTQNLLMASEASTVASAILELDLALEYLQNNVPTQGSTGIFWEGKRDDVGVWYASLLEARAVLEVDETDERPALVLEQVRPALNRRPPMGISVHGAHHQAWFWGGCMSFILGFLGGFLVLSELDGRRYIGFRPRPRSRKY